MIINIYDEISDKNAKEIIDKLNEITNKQEITIYIGGNGGSSSTADILIDAINKLKNKIVMVPKWYLASSTARIFLETKTIKKFINESIMLIHTPTITMDKREMKSETYSTIASKLVDIEIKRLLKYYKSIGITKKQIKQLKNGKDVYLTTKKIIKLCKNQGYKINKKGYK